MQLTVPKMVALLGAGAWGHNLLPLSNLWGTLLGRSRHHQGAQQLVFLLGEGVRQLLISDCTSGAPRAAPGHLPGTSPAPSEPGRRMPAGAARAGLPRLTAPLENKSRAKQVHFRLFYRSHHPAWPCRVEPALGRASLPRDEAGPAGHGPGSSPGQPWKSRAEQAELLGRGRQCPRQTAASRTYTAAARAANKAAEPAHSSARLVPSQRR